MCAGRSLRKAAALLALPALTTACLAALAQARPITATARPAAARARPAQTRAAQAPSPWITLTPGEGQVRLQFLAAYRTPRVCVRYGNCTRGPTGDYVVFTMHLESVGLRRECVPVHGFICSGEFSDVFAFGPGIKPCPATGTSSEEAESNPNICAPGRFEWRNAGAEVPGGLAGGDFSNPSKVVGNFVPGRTIIYRYLLTLASAPGHDRHVHSLADIWMSLDGRSIGAEANFTRVSALWPGGRLLSRPRIR